MSSQRRWITYVLLLLVTWPGLLLVGYGPLFLINPLVGLPILILYVVGIRHLLTRFFIVHRWKVQAIIILVPMICGFVYHSTWLSSIVQVFGASFLVGMFIWSALYAGETLVITWKKQNTWTHTLRECLFAAIMMYLTYLMFAMNFQLALCPTISTVPEYKTNIFTNECSYGPGTAGSCTNQLHWYEEEGCGDEEKKKEAFASYTQEI